MCCLADCIFIMAPMISTNVRAGVVKSLKQVFRSRSLYTWRMVLGQKPANYDENKPPILFVQGRNGNADSWYGKTVYHDINDMYDYALKAGYQTVFIQLYDAAGKGSASQWDNGKLLAQKLEEIYNHFGKKLIL